MAKKSKPKAKAKSKATAKRSSSLVANATALQPVNDKQHSTPHDKFVKSAFKNKAIAIDFFAHYLASRKFSRQDLENFNLSNTEHPRNFEKKIIDDVVYHGEILGQHYYILLEHQSSFDKTIVARLLEYEAAAMRVHLAQGRCGQAIVIPICLYHKPHPSRQFDDVQDNKQQSMLGRLYGSEQGAEYFQQKHQAITIVDLTIIDDEDISKHGRAAIVEWLLKDIQFPGEVFLQKAKEHLKLAGFDSKGMGCADFRESILEYILSVYSGNKPIDKVIEELCEVMPQEREIMGKLADTLRAEGMQEGMQKGRLEGISEGRRERNTEIISKMQLAGDTESFIKDRLDLDEEEFKQLSPGSAGSPSSLKNIESSPEHGKLIQNISSPSANDNLASGINGRTATAHPGAGLIFLSSRRAG